MSTIKQNPADGGVVCLISTRVRQVAVWSGSSVNKAVWRIKGTGKTKHGLEGDFKHLANLADADNGVVDDIATVFMLKYGVTGFQLRDLHFYISLFFLSLRQNFSLI
ncbi:hypothetical protein [Aquitalea denitrificans]|uniref:hypothetical protein n=1 Tax=Aquitalea denitrificans TaxID=519081 RepID=UPI00135994EA|nr:hypothetical protein [Aquitalea denitrificans]